MQPRSAALLAATVALVALAGCGSLTNDPGPGTPFAGPEETPTVDDGPGTTTPLGYGDLPQDAVDRHVAARDGRSVTVRFSGPALINGNLTELRWVARVDGDRRFTQALWLGNRSVTVFRNDSGLYRRFTRDGDVEYSYTEDPPPETPHDEYLRVLRAVLPDADWEKTGTTTGPNGTPVTRYEGSVTPQESGGLTVEPANATVLVGESGMVRALSLRNEIEVRNETLTVERSWTLTGVGETSVEPPAWVGNATVNEPPETDTATG